MVNFTERLYCDAMKSQILGMSESCAIWKMEPQCGRSSAIHTASVSAGRVTIWTD